MFEFKLSLNTKLGVIYVFGNVRSDISTVK